MTTLTARTAMTRPDPVSLSRPISGVSPAAVNDGTVLSFETVGRDAAPLRMRPTEDVLLRVIDGPLRLTVDEDELTLATGEEAIVRAGEPHRIAAADRTARVVMGFRAARLD